MKASRLLGSSALHVGIADLGKSGERPYALLDVSFRRCPCHAGFPMRKWLEDGAVRPPQTARSCIGHAFHGQHGDSGTQLWRASAVREDNDTIVCIERPDIDMERLRQAVGQEVGHSF